jgi:hypothetical protein
MVSRRYFSQESMRKLRPEAEPTAVLAVAQEV